MQYPSGRRSGVVGSGDIAGGVQVAHVKAFVGCRGGGTHKGFAGSGSGYVGEDDGIRHSAEVVCFLHHISLHLGVRLLGFAGSGHAQHELGGHFPGFRIVVGVVDHFFLIAGKCGQREQPHQQNLTLFHNRSIGFYVFLLFRLASAYYYIRLQRYRFYFSIENKK